MCGSGREKGHPETYNMAKLICTFVVAVAAALASTALADQPDKSQSTLTISREHVCGGKISRLQNGQFIEYLCRLTPSMFAEKIFDGGFEGVPDYKVAFRSQTDRIERPWYPDG